MMACYLLVSPTKCTGQLSPLEIGSECGPKLFGGGQPDLTQTIYIVKAAATFVKFMNIFTNTFRCASRQTSLQVTQRLFRQSRSAFRNPRTTQSRLFTTPPKPRAYINMAHSSADELATSLQKLGLENKLESFPNCYPELNPTDVYRAHITSILADITGADKSVIYPQLQWTMTLDKGDLILPVAALRIKGKKPQDLALEWAEKVCGSNAPTTM